MTEDFHALEIGEVRQETAKAVSFGLIVPAALADTFRYKPGQHVPVRATIDGEDIRRTYSISSGPSDQLLWITIKHVTEGVFSSWAHTSLKYGARLECMPPAGRFVLAETAPDGAPRRVIAVTAGSGITPVMSIIENVLVSEPDSSVTLVYGNRTVDDIIFRERLEGLKNRHLQRLQIFHVLSRDSEADVPLLAGRIDGNKLERLADALHIDGRDEILLCGPDTLIKESRDALIGKGATRERIRFEYFRAGPQVSQPPRSATPATAAMPVGAEVTALLDGTRRSFRVAEGEHVIDAGLAAGVRLPYSCKGGMCCTCRAKLVEGAVVMDRNFSLQDWEMEAGFVLTCQSRPTTARVVLDYDAA